MTNAARERESEGSISVCSARGRGDSRKKPRRNLIRLGHPNSTYFDASEVLQMIFFMQHHHIIALCIRYSHMRNTCSMMRQ